MIFLRPTSFVGVRKLITSMSFRRAQIEKFQESALFSLEIENSSAVRPPVRTAELTFEGFNQYVNRRNVIEHVELGQRIVADRLRNRDRSADAAIKLTVLR